MPVAASSGMSLTAACMAPIVGVVNPPAGLGSSASGRLIAWAWPVSMTANRARLPLSWLMHLACWPATSSGFRQDGRVSRVIRSTWPSPPRTGFHSYCFQLFGPVKSCGWKASTGKPG